MSLETLNDLLGDGGSHVNTQLQKVLQELRGLSFFIVAGAGAATKLDVPDIRQEDTILAFFETDTGVDQSANVTIAQTKAEGQIAVGAGLYYGDAVEVNGNIYTFKQPGTTESALDIPLDLAAPGSPDAWAAQLVDAINKYEARRIGGNFNTPEVVAVQNSELVEITAVVDGAAGNAITLVGTSDTLVTNGGGTLGGSNLGTDTGGVLCSNDTSGNILMVVYFNKRP